MTAPLPNGSGVFRPHRPGLYIFPPLGYNNGIKSTPTAARHTRGQGEQKMKKRNWKKRAAAGAVATAASAGLLMGAAFDSPADFLGDVDAISIVAHADDDGGDAAVGGEDEERSRKGSPFRRWVQGLPSGVRLAVCLPLWCLGTALQTLLRLLYRAALTPLGSTILSWVLAAAMVLGVFALTAKAMFPNIPLKKLLRPRHFLWLFAGVSLLAVADVVLPYFWEDWATLGKVLRPAGTAALVGLGALSLRRIGKRLALPRDPEAEVEAASDAADPRSPIEKQAMALADSVCPRPVYKT